MSIQTCDVCPLVKAAHLRFLGLQILLLISAVQNALDRISLLVIDFKYREVYHK